MNLTIGKIARQAGVGIETVRFYEKQGLLRELQRTEANYRLYPEEEVARLRFIKRAKELGFSLKEALGVFFYFMMRGGGCCGGHHHDSHGQPGHEDHDGGHEHHQTPGGA